MKSDSARNATTIRDVVRAVIASGGTLRLYVSDPDGTRRPRVIEGVPKSFLGARDGRDRVIIAVESASEPVEIRLLVDRITRAEKIDGEGQIDSKWSAGELPAEPTVSPVSARHARAVPGRPQHRTTQPGSYPRDKARAKAPVSTPVRRETPAVERSGRAKTERGARTAAATMPDLRKPTRR